MTPTAAAAGLLADGVIGEPPASIHPVAGFGRLMAALEPHLYRDDRVSGVVFVVAGVGVAAAAGFGVQTVLGPALGTFVAAEVAVAGRMLARTADDIRATLEWGDVDEARWLLPALVGRDPSGLPVEEISRAVIESVAENTVDAAVAPALWAGVLGAPGALTHRAVNTLDAMVGHRSRRYERFGWASARLDDALAWLPARVTAAAVAAVRPARAGAVWAAVRSDAPDHPSPNAGVAEAAFAAALGVRLGGTNRYAHRVEHRPVAHPRGRAPRPDDIAGAIRLARDVRIAVAGALVLLGGASAFTRRRSHRR